MQSPQFDLPCAGQVFNLSSERGIDPERVARERREAEQRQRDARDYERRMQRTFADCPGMVGGDLPDGPARGGKVVIEPGKLSEAVAWLKKRFIVNDEEIDLSGDFGAAVSFVTKRAPGAAVRRGRVHFKTQQYEFAL